MLRSSGSAASHPFSRLRLTGIGREEAGPRGIELLRCGVCRVDIHQAGDRYGIDMASLKAEIAAA